MKLRIRGNSVRLRLTKMEVARLVDVGWVEESTQAGLGAAGCFRYRLETDNRLEEAQSRLESLGLIIAVPAGEAGHWASSSDVGIYSETPWGLKIAVEKDFRCLDPSRTEDESDAFDNPAEGQHRACEAETSDRVEAAKS